MARVLIVEDEIFVALDLENILMSSGFTVSGIATDQASALSFANDSDVALVDVNLRDGPTGPAIATTLARQYGVRIIFVTANPAQIGDIEGLAVDVVNKPFRADAIIASVSHAATQAQRSFLHSGRHDDAAFMPLYLNESSLRQES
jgi:DNA-binding response OmpR family regulator